MIDGRRIDLIHAHGTGTDFNDPLELSAIESAMEEVSGESAVIYSHKGALGHSLGAAGLISIVLNCVAHQSGRVPGNVNTPHPLATLGGTISNRTVDRAIGRSLACASGFGGAIAVASLVSL
jgi:3-oxoacyl-[acyl-carrier-protein] synthase II